MVTIKTRNGNVHMPNFQFQMLDVKVRLAIAIMYKASVDASSDDELTVPRCPNITELEAHQNFWAAVARFYSLNFSKFSNEKILEIFKISKRNGYTFLSLDSRKIYADASDIINSTKYFHSSGVYEYELKTAQDWNRNTKVVRYAALIGGMFFGIQLPMDA